MASNQDTILTAFFAFAGGFLAGILLAPDSGSRTRGRIADEARGQVQRLEKKFAGLETELSGLRASVREAVVSAGSEVGGKVKDAAQHAVEQVVPGVPEDPEAFKVKGDDVTHDLKHMPRK